MNNLRSLLQRIEKLEQANVKGAITYTLPGGATHRMKLERVLTACSAAVFDAPSKDSQVLLQAVKCSTDCRLHLLLQTVMKDPN